MNQDRPNQHKEDTRYQEKDIPHGFVFNTASGLYEPISRRPEKNRSTDITGRHKRFPFKVDVKRDWLVIVISVITLIGLGATVYYSRQQWVANEVSAKAAQYSLHEFEKQTEIQRQELEGNLAAVIVVDSPRPTPFAMDAFRLRNQGLYIYFSNAGKVAATKMRAMAVLQRLRLPRFEIIGRPNIAQVLRDRLAPEELAHPQQGFVTEDFHVRLDTNELSLADLEKVQTEDEAIRVNGSVEYDNGFGHRITREFCFMYARIPALDDQGKDINGAIGTWGLCGDMVEHINRTYRFEH